MYSLSVFVSATVALLLVGCSVAPKPVREDVEYAEGSTASVADAGTGDAGLIALSGDSGPVSAGDARPGPLTGPVGQWVWNDVPGAVCGYGQQTGLAFNMGTSDKVMIYLEGGGLCFDEVSCELGWKNNTMTLGGIIPQSFGGLAQGFTTGYSKENFEQMIAKEAFVPGSGQDQWAGLSQGIFDRTLASNPYKDWSWVYIPYCTGDFHSGSSTRFFVTAQKTAHFAGRDNLALDLEKIVPSFPDASLVTLSGSSAGGIGSVLNYDFVAKAFHGKRVDLVSDSLPIFPGFPSLPVFPVFFAAWNTFAGLPADCPQCAVDATNLYAFLSKKYPAARFALTDHDSDTLVASLFLSEPGPEPAPIPSFYFNLGNLTKNVLGPLPNWKYWVSSSPIHTTLYDLTQSSVNHHCHWSFPLLPITPPTCVPDSPAVPPTTVALGDWLTQMATNDPAWTGASSIQAY